MTTCKLSLVVQLVEGEITSVNAQIETLKNGVQAAFGQVSTDCTAGCGTGKII